MHLAPPAKAHLLGEDQTLDSQSLTWGLMMNVLVHMSMCTLILYMKTTVMTGLRAHSVPREMQEIFWLTCAATSVCLAADLESLCCIVYSTALQKCIDLTGYKAESNWSGKFWWNKDVYRQCSNPLSIRTPPVDSCCHLPMQKWVVWEKGLVNSGQQISIWTVSCHKCSSRTKWFSKNVVKRKNGI